MLGTHAVEGFWEGSCPIETAYSAIRVNGKTNLTIDELTQAGVYFCARHLGRPDTYIGEHDCATVNHVFPDGRLPDYETGDARALLLLKCPAENYPNGRDMMRVTCQRIYQLSDDSDNSFMSGHFKEGYGVFFDGVGGAADCYAPAASTPVLNKGAKHDMIAGTRKPVMRRKKAQAGNHRGWQSTQSNHKNAYLWHVAHRQLTDRSPVEPPRHWHAHGAAKTQVAVSSMGEAGLWAVADR